MFDRVLVRFCVNRISPKPDMIQRKKMLNFLTASTHIRK